MLARLPVAAAEIRPVTVKVTEAPTGRLTVVLMLPPPLAVHVPPAVPVHIHVTPLNDAGMVSVTVAAVAADGPLLAATIV